MSQPEFLDENTNINNPKTHSSPRKDKFTFNNSSSSVQDTEKEEERIDNSSPTARNRTEIRDSKTFQDAGEDRAVQKSKLDDIKQGTMALLGTAAVTFLVTQVLPTLWEYGKNKFVQRSIGPGGRADDFSQNAKDLAPGVLLHYKVPMRKPKTNANTFSNSMNSHSDVDERCQTMGLNEPKDEDNTAQSTLNSEINDDHFTHKPDWVKRCESIRPDFSHLVQLAYRESFVQRLHDAVMSSMDEKIAFYASKHAETLGNGDGSTQGKDSAHVAGQTKPPENAVAAADRRDQLTALAAAHNRLVRLRESGWSYDRTAEGLMSAIFDTEKGMLALNGRRDIQDALASQICAFANNPIVWQSSFQNFVITGNAGAGKTRLGGIIGFVFTRCGIMTGGVRMLTKTDFTTGYVDESSRMTRNVLFRSLEDVIVIDEAYAITPEHGGGNRWSHGTEALTELVNFMDKYAGKVVICALGYANEMVSRFLNANEGIPRRFRIRFDLADQSADELAEIFIISVKKQAPEITFVAEEKILIRNMMRVVAKKHPAALVAQAGAVSNLATAFVELIYSSRDGINWNNRNEVERSAMIDNAFRDLVEQSKVKQNATNKARDSQARNMLESLTRR